MLQKDKEKLNYQFRDQPKNPDEPLSQTNKKFLFLILFNTLF